MKKNKIPLVLEPISAGFPNAAEDAPTTPIDLNDLIIKHPAATFYMRVKGSSMKDLGILENDVVVVDKSLETQHGDVVVAYINGEFTLKTFAQKAGKTWLQPANPDYEPIEITEDSDFQIWGKVVAVVRDRVTAL